MPPRDEYRARAGVWNASGRDHGDLDGVVPHFRERVPAREASISVELYRGARIRAAERGSSVRALAGEYLSSLSQRQVELHRLEAQQREVQREIRRFRAGGRPGRDEIHDRAVR